MAALSELVLDHFRNPRNSGALANSTHRTKVENPVCGDILELSARVENEQIREVKFLCRGCTTAIACASWLTEQVAGKSLAGARGMNAEAISVGLGGLPEETKHGAVLAADALKALLRTIVY